MLPTNNEVPKHIGIILDGNRRFAKRLMAKPWKGHEWGKDKVEKVMLWAKEAGVKQLTLYAFSIENFNRPKAEFDYLMNICKETFTRIKDDPKMNDVKINFVGRIQKFPQDVQDAMHELMQKTKEHTPFTINFAMAYGGQQEIVDATKKIIQEVEQGKASIADINKEFFEKHLDLTSEPELIIRTGGEQRLSNFLTFQSAYTEFIFLTKFWPEFEKQDFQECIAEYQARQRRFGR